MQSKPSRTALSPWLDKQVLEQDGHAWWQRTDWCCQPAGSVMSTLPQAYPCALGLRCVRHTRLNTVRMQAVLVEEPSPEAALACLVGLKPRYESHHGVRFTQEALSTAVAAAQRYIPDRCARVVHLFWGPGVMYYCAGRLWAGWLPVDITSLAAWRRLYAASTADINVSSRQATQKW